MSLSDITQQLTGAYLIQVNRSGTGAAVGFVLTRMCLSDSLLQSHRSVCEAALFHRNICVQEAIQ